MVKSYVTRKGRSWIRQSVWLELWELVYNLLTNKSIMHTCFGLNSGLTGTLNTLLKLITVVLKQVDFSKRLDLGHLPLRTDYSSTWGKFLFRIFGKNKMLKNHCLPLITHLRLHLGISHGASSSEFWLYTSFHNYMHKQMKKKSEKRLGMKN